MAKLTNVFLNALLGECTLDFLCRGCGISEGDPVFVDTGGGFFEEVAACTSKERRLPIEATMLTSNQEERGIVLMTGAGKFEDGGET